MSWDAPTACNLNDPTLNGSTVSLNYVKPIIDWIDSQPAKFNGKNYMEGFSQNAAVTGYLAKCLADKITGMWTGGGGKAHDEGERWNGGPWPCFSPEGPMIFCTGIYSNDYMLDKSGGIKSRLKYYDLMIKEGNDPRMFIIKGPSDDGTIGGNHYYIENRMHWQAGCWGINENCDEMCESKFFECMSTANVTTALERTESFSTCIFSMEDPCTECTPTFNMLKESEDLIEYKFENFGATDPSLPHERSNESHCVMPSLWDNA